MSQTYENIPVTEKIKDSLPKILGRDQTGITLSSGTSFPQDLESWMIGRLCLRTDLHSLYYLESVNPVKWTLIIDFGSELASKDYVDNEFQPKNSNLTALSELNMSSDKIPYFNSATTMSLLTFTNFFAQMIQAQNAAAMRTILALGALATVSSITSSNSSQYIADNSIGASKLNFTPITVGEGYTIGDIKESYDSDDEDNYLLLNQGYTIGSSSSNATYKGNDYSDLYNMLWTLSATTLYNTDGTVSAKGSTASQDWSANKYLSLPEGLSYMNPNCYYKLRYK